MNIETNKFENFLQVNDKETGIIIFIMFNKHACLCSVEQLFMDGTYKCCLKSYFYLPVVSRGNGLSLISLH